MSFGMQSEKIDILVSALVKVQAALKPAFKNRVNPHFKSKYADLESIWESCRELLSNNNLAIIQTTDFLNGQAVLKTMLCHGSGQWVSGDYPLTPDKPTPQSLGTALKYARRYSLECVIGIVSNDDPEDDDGELVENRQQVQGNAALVAISPFPKAARGFQVGNDAPMQNSAPWPEGTMVSDNIHVGQYMVGFGKKYKGKTLNEMGAQEVRGYLNWMKQEADKKGETLKGQVAEFADAAEKFLAVSEEVPF